MTARLRMTWNPVGTLARATAVPDGPLAGARGSDPNAHASEPSRGAHWAGKGAVLVPCSEQSSLTGPRE
jgi:hypothetical protein